MLCENKCCAEISAVFTLDADYIIFISFLSGVGSNHFKPPLLYPNFTEKSKGANIRQGLYLKTISFKDGDTEMSHASPYC